jgi:hypothetical protein
MILSAIAVNITFARKKNSAARLCAAPKDTLSPVRTAAGEPANPLAVANRSNHFSVFVKIADVPKIVRPCP